MNSKELSLSCVNNGKPFTMYYEKDRFIQEVLIDKEYEKLIEKQLLERHDLVILDLGCNIGSFSLSLYDNAKDIYALDFSQGCIDLLTTTKEVNGFDKLHIYKQAIAGTNRPVKVTSLSVTDGGNTIYGDKDEIQAITLATFFHNVGLTHVDLLKVDIEGAENEIFKADDFKEIAPHIHTIIGEAHTNTIPPGLEDAGYECSVEGYKFVATYGNNRTPHQEL